MKRAEAIGGGLARRLGRAPLAWAACVFLASACFAAGAHAQAELRIAVEGAYPPFNYAEGNEPAGFEVDLGRALCEAMKLPCVFVLQDWDGMYGALRTKKVDAIMSSMEVTSERRTRYAFSRHYYRIPAALVGRKEDTAFSGPASLEGRTVGVVQDSDGATYLEGLPAKPDIRTYGKLEDAWLDLLTGRIDYVLGDKLGLARFVTAREGEACCRFIADLPVDRGEGVAVAVRKGDHGLAEMFNAAIASVIADGTYDRIRAKYIPFDVK